MDSYKRVGWLYRRLGCQRGIKAGGKVVGKGGWFHWAIMYIFLDPFSPSWCVLVNNTARERDPRSISS